MWRCIAFWYRRVASLWLIRSLPLTGANISGVIPGFNTTVLKNLPRSMLLIHVESVLMGFAFLAMVIVSSKRPGEIWPS